MIYKSQFTGVEIDDGINKARQALTATDQNAERIQILEADNENNKTQIGALDVRLDNVEIKVNNIPQFSLAGTTLTITLPA